MTERELAHELFDACRQLLRYDGIDKYRIRQAVDRIGEAVRTGRRSAGLSRALGWKQLLDI